MKLQPKRPELLDDGDPRTSKMNRSLLIDAKINGMEAWTAVDRFDEWFQRLNLPERKQIIPLGCNYQFDKDFIVEWLGGPLNYCNYFRSDCRDVQSVAAYINDCCNWHTEPIPFPKWSLKYLCSQLGIENIHAHDAVHDCIATIKVYKTLMQYRDVGSFLPRPKSIEPPTSDTE